MTEASANVHPGDDGGRAGTTRALIGTTATVRFPRTVVSQSRERLPARRRWSRGL